MFIIFEEDFLLNRERTIKKIYNFLDLNMPENLNLNVKSNTKSSYRSKFITNFINKPHVIKNIIKVLISKKYINNIKNIINKANRKNVQKKDLPNKSKMKYLSNKFYKSEINKMEEFLDRNLDIWRN